MKLYTEWVLGDYCEFMEFEQFKRYKRRRSRLWRTAWRVSGLFKRVYMLVVDSKPVRALVSLGKLKI